MRLRPRQHFIVRRGLVFKVVGLNVILAHGVVFEPVPHQNAAQVGMAGEDDPVEIEDLALLKLGRAPDGRERGQLDLVGAVRGRMRSTSGPMLLRDRNRVVDRFKIARLDALAGFVDGFFDRLLDAVDGLRDLTCYFHFFRDLFVGPIDAGDVGKKIEGQFGVVAQKRRDGDGARGCEPQRVLRARAGIGHNLNAAPGTAASIAALISSTVFNHSAPRSSPSVPSP